MSIVAPTANNVNPASTATSSIVTTWNTQAPYDTAKDALTRLHWSVIPIDDDKQPVKTGGFWEDGNPKRLKWKPLQAQLPAIHELTNWQQRFKPMAWAIVTGALSGKIILDYDGETGRRLVEKYGFNPHVRTGSGGYHQYFQHPGWYVQTLNGKSKENLGKAWPGLDIRADGGYAVFCGRNPKGPYEWLREPVADDLSAIPDAIRRDLGLLWAPDSAEAQAYKQLQAREYIYSELLNKAAARVAGGHGRDNTAYWLASQLRDNNFSEREAMTVIADYVNGCPAYNAKGEHELFTFDTAREKVRSAYAGMKREAWTFSDKPGYASTKSTNGTSPSAGSHSGNNGATPPPPTKSVAEFLCEFTPDDAGNGDAMLALYGNEFLWCSSRGWFRDIGTHWELDTDGAAVKRRAVETLRKRRHAAVDTGMEAIIKCTKGDEGRVNGCVSRFKTLVSVNIDSFDCDPDKLNCLNGVVDLRTGRLEEHNPTHRFTYCLPVDYDPEADWSDWREFLQGVVHEKLLDYLQMVSGYSLTGHTREEILFYLNGPTRSGKGTFAETFMALLPSPLSTMVDFNSFTAKRDGDVSNFDLAPLKPARMIFASESNRSQSLNPAKIKQLTGGDRIRACFKHRDHFDFRPQFKVWMMSNHPVNGDPEDDALWGRVRVIEFPNSFLGKEDKSKKSRLKEPEMLKGVLAWAVQGSIKWYALGSAGLTTPEAIVKTTQAQRTSLDYVQQWLDECCEEVDDEDAWEANEDIIASYTQWCTHNNVEEKKSPNALSQSLKAKGHAIGKQKKVKGKNKKGVQGLYIRPIEESNGNDGNA